ncbi:MAG: hypothetical protein GX235_01150 [Clostridiales bacterium]|nr:hypothetical protein [Clostridiales bacterium]
MNINFENNVVKTHSNVDKATTQTSYSGSHVKETNSASRRTQGVFALDISGTVMDNTAYDGQGKTAEDVMQDAGQVDVATQKNYMAVMSNIMSEEDFAKLQEEGYHPGDTDIETVVTIVDEIKAALAKGGKNITGYTDDLDVETLTQITGSASLANELVKQFKEHDIPATKENVEDVMNACRTATELEDLSDGIKKYMIRNHMEPTLDNIYRAQYSATADTGKQSKGYYQDDAGYYAKKAEDFNWQQLMPQIEKVIRNAGLEVSEETLSDAKWLIEKGMPLTEESLKSYYDLNNLELPDTLEEAVKAATAAIANGKRAGSANLLDDRTDLEKAWSYIDDVNSISDEAIDKVAAEGEALNLRNLKAAQLRINAGVSTALGTATYAVNATGRRQLEEIRLQMTVQANLHLIRSGISVDTVELEQLVEVLKGAEQQNRQILFGGDGAEGVAERAQMYGDTLAKVKEIPHMPAAVIGKIALQRDSLLNRTNMGAANGYTLEAVYLNGNALRTAYEKAGETYETLMTAPRADLGDSIKKAFRNVDDILRDMNLETSDANRRAVRILGYNRMEISEQNIAAIKETDATVRRIVNKMTPASTLEMIRDGMNPLSMNMEELEAYLDSKDRNPERSIEKYSEFLYKLDKNNEITSEERDAYIGIYRLFRQLDKTDGAAIGTLINQGMEPTVKNLLSAMRSNKKHGMDITVDDYFGGISSEYQGKSISEQIESGYKANTSETNYYKKLSLDIFDSLEGGKLPVQAVTEDMTLEELAALLQEQEADTASKKEYQKHQMSVMREATMTEETIVKELLSFNQPVTVNNLLAAGLLTKERGMLAGKMKEFASQTDETEQLEEAIRNLHENMTAEASAKEAYDKFSQIVTDILDKVVYEQSAEDGANIDIREISNMYKQISLAINLAKEENYEVPVDINGEMTSINLRIIHNAGESGRVTASLQSAVYGKVLGKFNVAKQSGTSEDSLEYQITGYVVCDSKEGLNALRQSEEKLKNSFEQSDIHVNSLNFIYNRELDFSVALQTDEIGKEGSNSEEGIKKQEVSTKKLYETAKMFISYIQKGEGF